MKSIKRTVLAGVTVLATCAAAAPGQAIAGSDSCTEPAATGVDGYVLNSYVKLTAQRRPDDPKTTWVCYRAYDRGRDVGGRIDVTDATVSPTLPSADGDGTACTTTVPNVFPGPRPLFGGQVGGDPGDPTYTPFLVDAYLAPYNLWGCLQAGPVGARVKVATSGIAGPNVSVGADEPGTPLPTQKQGPSGYPSNKCLEGAWHVRDVNMQILDTHVWAYHWPESPTRQAVCLRVERPGMQPIGYRVYVDTNNTPGVTPVVESSLDTTPCTSTVAAIDQPVQARISSSPRGANPASVCVEAAGVKHRITVGTSGDVRAPLIGRLKDPDSV
ncbi:MAG TPA: hypothetical protein VF587_16105 [Solirubrobacteraceae bacterium]|jgi:hypothetical protein